MCPDLRTDVDRMDEAQNKDPPIADDERKRPVGQLPKRFKHRCRQCQKPILDARRRSWCSEFCREEYDRVNQYSPGFQQPPHNTGKKYSNRGRKKPKSGVTPATSDKGREHISTADRVMNTHRGVFGPNRPPAVECYPMARKAWGRWAWHWMENLHYSSSFRVTYPITDPRAEKQEQVNRLYTYLHMHRYMFPNFCMAFLSNDVPDEEAMRTTWEPDVCGKCPLYPHHCGKDVYFDLSEEKHKGLKADISIADTEAPTARILVVAWCLNDKERFEYHRKRLMYDMRRMKKCFEARARKSKQDEYELSFEYALSLYRKTYKRWVKNGRKMGRK